MLYDPKWERPSLAGFKAWLERQNPNDTFDYADCQRCAVGQYLQSIGRVWESAEGDMLTELNLFACRATHIAQSPTFGAVLREIEFAEAL